MAENSKIEWTTHTFNPWMGCQHVSSGCDRCFAEALMDTRYGKVTWGPHGERVRTSEANWKQPLRWARKAREDLIAWENTEEARDVVRGPRPVRPRVFCASLADVWDNQVPPEWRRDLFQLIWETPELDWLLLTKRPENISRMIDDVLKRPLFGRPFGPWPWPNVWLGFTGEDQPNFNRRWPIIRDIPAVVRFCSYEPAIGPLRLPPTVELLSPHAPHKGLHWLICGGESGPGYRSMDPEWEANIRLDCAAAGVAYFLKQMAGKKPIPSWVPIVREFPKAA